MGKRKTTSLEEELEEKFKKFKEDILRKRRQRRHQVLPLSSSSESESESHTAEDERDEPLARRRRIASPPPSVSSRRSRSRQRSISRPGSSRRHKSPTPTQRASRTPPSPVEPSTSTFTVTADVHQQPTPDENSNTTPEEIPLDDDILQLLGEAPKTDVALGNPIHKDIADRWQEILSKGLSKEVRDKLLQEYQVPNNCELLLAPTLNPEAKAAISEMMVKRDSALTYTQKQLGIAISALSVATNLIISKESSTQNILKPISDACRLLCDIHRYETQNRRKFVISAINTTLKDTLLESTRDKLLFGENLTDKLKAAKTIQRSGDALKNATRHPFNKSNFAYRSQNKNRLNWKFQHRKTDGKPFGNNNRGRPTMRAPPPRRNSGAYRSDRDRSPPRRNHSQNQKRR